MRSPEKKNKKKLIMIYSMLHVCARFFIWLCNFFLFPVNNGINVDNVTSHIDTGVMSLHPYLKLCGTQLNATVNMLTC